MALGSYSPFLLAPIHVPCNVYPAKGYSATIDIGDHRGAPTVSLTDFAWKIVLTRLGQRLRVAGTAELTGWDTSLNPTRCEALTARTFELFPDAGDRDSVRYWTGLRPATPSNAPLIGRTRYRNLFLNTGPRHARLDDGVRLGGADSPTSSPAASPTSISRSSAHSARVFVAHARGMRVGRRRTARSGSTCRAAASAYRWRSRIRAHASRRHGADAAQRNRRPLWPALLPPVKLNWSCAVVHSRTSPWRCPRPRSTAADSSAGRTALRSFRTSATVIVRLPAV